MSLTPDEKLRQLLGEEVPDGESDAATLFRDNEILQLLEANPSVETAALEGWRVKAAKLSALVDTTEGNSQRKFSQLLQNAESMVRLYLRASSGPTEGRSRVGRSRRPPLEWS